MNKARSFVFLMLFFVCAASVNASQDEKKDAGKEQQSASSQVAVPAPGQPGTMTAFPQGPMPGMMAGSPFMMNNETITALKDSSDIIEEFIAVIGNSNIAVKNSDLLSRAKNIVNRSKPLINQYPNPTGAAVK